MSSIDGLFQDDPLFARAMLGQEAERFIKGPVGRHVIARAEKQIEQAYQALSVADPEDPKLIRDLQHKISVARAVPHWLALAVQDGIMAEQQIEREEVEE